MKKKKDQSVKLPMSLTKKAVLVLLAAAAIAGLAYLTFYLCKYTFYNDYKKYLKGYETEAGTEFVPTAEASPSVKGMQLVAENDILKLYTDTSRASIAVYDKRDGSITRSNPEDPDGDEIANKANKNFLKSQMLVYYYNSEVKSGSLDTWSGALEKGQYSWEALENGIRYNYTVGDIYDTLGNEGISFDISLDYRLDGDSITVSMPADRIAERGNCKIYRIQLLRYMGAGHKSEKGYMVVPNGSGSLINFNNGKTSENMYNQYVYDIDPLVSDYTTRENLNPARLPIFGICREDRSMLVTIEEGATTAVISAGVSGMYNDYNFAFPIFVLRNRDNLRSFGNATTDTYVLEEDAYDLNYTVRYSFPGSDYKGYSGIANYYREKLVEQGALPDRLAEGDIPFYYDVIGEIKETGHFLGMKYLHAFPMTTFEQAEEMAQTLDSLGAKNQVMNLQGWFNGGYYHDAADRVKIPLKLGGKSGLASLNSKLEELGGTLCGDVAFQKVTFEDDGYNYNAETSRYYGVGYAVSFGQVHPTTLRNTASLGYGETLYNVLSPRYLSRYVKGFTKNVSKLELDGISLRDLASMLQSDKKRTNVIDREQALNIVKAQLGLIKDTDRRVISDGANAYAFGYVRDVLNVPMRDNPIGIVDESIPLYQMIIHGRISYSTELMNFESSDEYPGLILKMIETGTAPHFVFTAEESNLMKDTGMNRYYATTFSNWSGLAVDTYRQVNDVLKAVQGAELTCHTIFDSGVRKCEYSNGAVIYVNYSDEAASADGLEIPAKSYRLEGR